MIQQTENIPCYSCPVFAKCLSLVNGSVLHYYSDIISCKLIKRYIGATEITKIGFTYPSEKEQEVEAVGNLFIDKYHPNCFGRKTV